MTGAVPFIDPDFLERERRELLPEVYASEYDCTFGTGLSGATLFDPDTFDALLVDEEAS